VTELVQALTTGVLVGLSYAVLGVGFSLTWGATGVINAAHTMVAVIGAYLGYQALAWWGVDPVLALVGILPLFFFAGWGFFELLIRPLKQRVRVVGLASVVLTLGTALVLESLTTLAFSANPRLVRTDYTSISFAVGPARVSGGAAVAGVISLVVIGLLYWYRQSTYMGRALRALEQDPEGAALTGIDVRRASAVAMGVAFATAGAAGVALSLIYTFSPNTFLSWLVFTFLVVILGGVGTVLGVTLAGLIAGLVVTLSSLVIPFAWANLVLFVVLILVLLFRPTGLMRR
jgi:branched-chain amino acid transport system permease protein